MFEFFSRLFRRAERGDTAPLDSQSADYAIGTEFRDQGDLSEVLCAAPIHAEVLYAAPVGSLPSPTDDIDPKNDFHPDGLPPDWWGRRGRRIAVLRRDDVQCQVTGCINTTCLDVHHIKPRFEQPDHRLENLITLCRLHHVLLPFHRAVAERLKSDRYTGVSAHWKWNGTLRFPVRASIRRSRRVTLSDLGQIKDRYGLVCGCCRATDLRARIFEDQQAVRVRCPACNTVWMFDQGLHEEIGAQMASVLVGTRNKGKFEFNIDHLEVPGPVNVYTCLDCATANRVAIMQPIDGDHGKFWGCPQWNGDTSHYTRPWRNGDERHVWRWNPDSRKSRISLASKPS